MFELTKTVDGGPRIAGFEILVYTYDYPALGRVLDYRIHYGASPIRDKRSMDAQLDQLRDDGLEFTVHPL